MKIVTGFPSNFAKIRAALPGATNPNVLFCYGDTIYTPSGVHIPPELIAHEEVHSRRQGANPEAWWDRYITDPQFRFDEELAAHIREYEVATANNGRHARRKAISLLAGRLSGPLYGGVVSRDRARNLILSGVAPA